MTFARGLSHEVAAEGIRSHSVLRSRGSARWFASLAWQPEDGRFADPA